MFIFLYERAGCNHPAANGVTSFSFPNFTNCALCFVGNARQPQTRHCSSSCCLKELFDVTLSHCGLVPQIKPSPTQRDHLIPSAARFVQWSSSQHRKTWKYQKDRGKRCREEFQGWNSPELKSTAGETKAVVLLSPLDKIQQLSGRKLSSCCNILQERMELWS